MTVCIPYLNVPGTGCHVPYIEYNSMAGEKTGKVTGRSGTEEQLLTVRMGIWMFWNGLDLSGRSDLS